MTDERYVYTQDQRDRKRTASGARAKKGGSRSKRCPLPSDTLTKAQKDSLNGPVESVNLNQLMTYAQLKELTPTLQFLYLDHLVTVHKARRIDLQEMLGIANRTLELQIKGLPEKLVFKKGRRSPAPEWMAFLGSTQPAQEAAQAPDAETQAPAPAETENAPQAATEPTPAILAGSITVRTTASGMLAALLRLIDDPAQTYTFTVNFTE